MEQERGINQNLLNIITPPGIEFQRTRLLLGKSYSKCVMISSYPTNPDYGWLANITHIEGVTSSIEFCPTPSGDLVARCNEQIREYRNDLTTVKDESIRQSKEKAIEDIKNMISRIGQENEIVGYVTIVLMVQALSEKKLEEREKKLESIISSLGGSTRNITFLQKEALRCVAPYGIPNEKITNIAARNMPLSTFIGGFVNASSGLNDGVGFLIGKSDSGQPIIIDTWMRGGDRTNSNWIITGLPGVGKSATVKNIILREYALGAKVVFLDPEREYIGLTENLGGKIINCGGASGGIINILHVRPAPKNIDEEETEEKDSGASDLALHFQTVRSFIKIYKPSITDLEVSQLEEILETTYKRFGIDWNTDISKLKATQFPIFSDLYDDIEQKLNKNPDDSVLQNLCAYFRSIARGADSFIFNGHTDVDFTSNIIDLDISSLLDADPCILRAQFHNINSYIWKLISDNREEKIIYAIDEGYLIVDPENPEAINFVKNVSKRIRKYQGSLMFITHSVVDLLDPAVKRQGQAIIDNACFKFIMGTDGKNLKETKDLFNLTEAEEALLLSKQRGRGLFYAGSVRINAKIEIPEKFLQLMGKAGGK